MSTQSHPTARQCTHKRGNYSWIGGNTSYLLAKTSVGFRRTVSGKVKDAKAYQYSIFYINSKLSFAFFWFPLHDIPYLLNWLLLSNKISSLNRIRSIKSPYRVEVACTYRAMRALWTAPTSTCFRQRWEFSLQNSRCSKGFLVVPRHSHFLILDLNGILHDVQKWVLNLI